jgi:PAS domain S-box-containing protein
MNRSASFPNIRQTGRASSLSSPARLLTMVILVVFLAEFTLMLVLWILPPLPEIVTSLLDSFLLVLLIFPALYFLMLQPMTHYLDARRVAEKDATRSGQLLEKIFHNDKLYSALLDREFNFIRVNKSFAAGAGRAQEDFTGKNIFALFPIAEFRPFFTEALANASPYITQQTQFSWPDQPERGISYWDWTLLPIQEENKFVSGLMLIVTDRTNYVKASRAVEQTQQFYEDLVNAIDGIIWEADPHTHEILYVSSQAERLLGYPVRNWAEVPGFWKDHIHPEDQGAVLERLERAVEGKENTNIEYRMIAQDGRILWMRNLISAIIENQHVVKLRGVMIDITERKQDEINMVRLLKAEASARHLAETLSKASLDLTQSLELENVLRILLQYLHRLISFDQAYVGLLNDQNPPVIFASQDGSEVELSSGVIPQRIKEKLLRIPELFKGQDAVLISNVHVTPEWKDIYEPAGLRSLLAVEVTAGINVIGYCVLEAEEASSFTQEDVDYAKALVSQAAVAVQNAWLFNQVRSGRERLQQLSHRLVEVQENERRYISRELHDEAGQALTSLMVGLRLLNIRADDPEALDKGIRELKDTANNVIVNLHRLAMDLRPVSLDHLGLAAALRSYSQSIQDRFALPIHFDVSGIPDDRLKIDIETALYRIVQESVTNAVRHSHASRIDIVLKQQDEKVILTIKDNGVGFDPALVDTTKHLGLLGIHERAEMIGGKVTIASKQKAGTSIVVEVPNVH